MTAHLQLSQDALYPDTDGLPLSNNTKQLRLILMTQGGLDALFQNENVFVAGDLLWHPLKDNPDKERSKAPDVMVIFGQDKRDRRSYKQWEEGNLGPQVVFEFVSQSNSTREVEDNKFRFYQKHGVEEYYTIQIGARSRAGCAKATASIRLNRCRVGSAPDWVSVSS